VWPYTEHRLIYGTPFNIIKYRSHKLLKTVLSVFLGATCISTYRTKLTSSDINKHNPTGDLESDSRRYQVIVEKIENIENRYFDSRSTNCVCINQLKVKTKITPPTFAVVTERVSAMITKRLKLSKTTKPSLTDMYKINHTAQRYYNTNRPLRRNGSQ